MRIATIKAIAVTGFYLLLQKRSKKATQFVGLFRLFQFAWLFLVLDFCKYGPGKSWKSPGILMDQWCTNPVLANTCDSR